MRFEKSDQSKALSNRVVEIRVIDFLFLQQNKKKKKDWFNYKKFTSIFQNCCWKKDSISIVNRSIIINLQSGWSFFDWWLKFFKTTSAIKNSYVLSFQNKKKIKKSICYEPSKLTIYQSQRHRKKLKIKCNVDKFLLV